MITNILLSILIVIELVRFYLSYKNGDKKDFFKQKIDNVHRQIWEWEFRIFKTKEVREDIRKELDNAVSRSEITKNSIKNWPKDKPKEDKAKIEDELTLMERDIERFKKQIDNLDLEIYGSKPTNEHPDGVLGFQYQIDSLRELEEMLKEWVKEL